jgi:hypothetical protein
MKMHGGVEVQFHAFITSVLDGLVRFTTKPLHIPPPGGKIVYKAV